MRPKESTTSLDKAIKSEIFSWDLATPANIAQYCERLLLQISINYPDVDAVESLLLLSGLLPNHLPKNVGNRLRFLLETQDTDRAVLHKAIFFSYLKTIFGCLESYFICTPEDRESLFHEVTVYILEKLNAKVSIGSDLYKNIHFFTSVSAKNYFAKKYRMKQNVISPETVTVFRQITHMVGKNKDLTQEEIDAILEEFTSDYVPENLIRLFLANKQNNDLEDINRIMIEDDERLNQAEFFTFSSLIIEALESAEDIYQGHKQRDIAIFSEYYSLDGSAEEGPTLDQLSKKHCISRTRVQDIIEKQCRYLKERWNFVEPKGKSERQHPEKSDFYFYHQTKDPSTVVVLEEDLQRMQA